MPPPAARMKSYSGRRAEDPYRWVRMREARTEKQQKGSSAGSFALLP